MREFSVRNEQSDLRSKHTPAVREPRRRVDEASTIPYEAHTIFRKASCACGGGCPSCQAAGGLKVSNPSDAAEVEADRVADRVMRMPAGNSVGGDIRKEQSSPIVQRRATEAGVPISGEIGGRINASRGGGVGLDAGTRGFMESRFGVDLGGVRIHTGSEAAGLSRDLGAQAFSLSNDIYFGEGRYQPGTDSGRHLLAHELTHTLQQKGAPPAIHRKVEVESGVELTKFKDHFTKSGNVYSFDSEPFRDKKLDLEILTSMFNSPRTFKLKGKTSDEAQVNLVDHIQGREGVVEFAKKRQYAFVGGEAGFKMNPKYWTWGGGKFKSKPGVNLDEARNDLNQNPEMYAIGCAAAAQLTVKAGAHSESVPSTTSEPKDWIPGETGFIENTKWDGSAGLQGENIIYMGKKTFFGHTPGDKPIKTYQEWFKIVDGWNQGAKLSEDRTYPVKGLKTD